VNDTEPIQGAETPLAWAPLEAAQSGTPPRSVADPSRVIGNTFFALAETLPAIVLIHQNGQARYVNTAAEAILGRPRETILRMHFWEVVRPDYQQVVRERGLNREKGEPTVPRYEIPIVVPGGEVRWLDCMACRIEFEGKPAVLCAAFDITDAKRTEEQLRASDERFRQLAENIREVFWMTDLEKTQTLYISSGYEAIWGRTRASVYASPRDWLEAIHSEDRERVLQAALVKQANGQYDEMYRIRRSDGSIRWIHDRAFPVRDEDGKVYRVAGIAEDITDRRLAEIRDAALSKLGYQLSRATTTHEAAKMILDIALELFQWDACYLHLLSPDHKIIPILTIDTMNGQRTEVPSDSFTLDPSPLMLEVLARGSRLINRDGLQSAAVDTVPFGDVSRSSASMMYAAIYRGSKAIGILSVQSYTPHAYTQEDLITLRALVHLCGGALERIKLTDALSESERTNRALLEAIPDWIFRVRRDGAIVNFKPPKTAALSQSDLEAASQGLFEVFRSRLAHQFLHYIERAFQTGQPQTINLPLWLGGVTREFEVRIVVAGKEEALAIVTDITDRKRLENEIIEISTRERRRIGQDLHDNVGQQLTGIGFLAQTLQETLREQSLSEADKAAEIARMVAKTITNARSLSRELVQVELDDLGIVPALQNLAADISNLFDVACVVNTTEPIVVDNHDRILQLYRIAQEAVTNAIKHGKAKQILIDLTAENDRLSLKIRDNGAGFAEQPEKLQGMGLRIMKYRATRLGATLDIQSEPGHGTVVTCSFVCASDKRS
jgi:PAS domain S-box-containing protein